MEAAFCCMTYVRLFSKSPRRSDHRGHRAQMGIPTWRIRGGQGKNDVILVGDHLEGVPLL